MPSLGARRSELCFMLSVSRQSLPGGKRTRSVRNRENQTPPPQTAVGNGPEGVARARQRGAGRGARGAEWRLDAEAEVPGTCERTR